MISVKNDKKLNLWDLEIYINYQGVKIIGVETMKTENFKSINLNGQTGKLVNKIIDNWLIGLRE